MKCSALTALVLLLVTCASRDVDGRRIERRHRRPAYHVADTRNSEDHDGDVTITRNLGGHTPLMTRLGERHDDDDDDGRVQRRRRPGHRRGRWRVGDEPRRTGGAGR